MAIKRIRDPQEEPVFFFADTSSGTVIDYPAKSLFANLIGLCGNIPLDRFTRAQVEKYRSGIQLKCSPGFLLEIKRKAIGGDLGI